MYSVVVNKYGDPEILEYIKSDSQKVDHKSVKIKVNGKIPQTLKFTHISSP